MADIDEAPESEYLCEARAVLALLRDGSGCDEIAAYLSRTVASFMVKPDLERDHRAAEAIFEAYHERRVTRP